MYNKKINILVILIISIVLVTAWWFGYYYKIKSNSPQNINGKYNLNIKNVEKNLSEKDKVKYLERIKIAQWLTNSWTKLQIMETYNELGFCYQQLWDYQNAVNNYTKTLELWYDEVALNNIAGIFGENNDYIRSNKFYLQLMKNRPDDAEILEKIINNYLKAWDKNKALRTLDDFAANYWGDEKYKEFIIRTRQFIENYK